MTEGEIGEGVGGWALEKDSDTYYVCFVFVFVFVFLIKIQK